MSASKSHRSTQSKVLRVEQLERRQLMAADLVGVVRNNLWLMNKENSDTGHDMDLSFGLAGDTYVAGKWTTNVDHPGVVRSGSPDGLLHWYLDTDGDATHELDVAFGLLGDKPVAGDWDRNGLDNVGVVRSGYQDGLLRWYLDTDGDAEHEIERVFGLNGDIPIAGDFNGDSIDDIAVVRSGYPDGMLRTFVNYNANSTEEDTFLFGANGDIPVTGDFDGNNIDELAMVRSNPSSGLLDWYVNRDHDAQSEAFFSYGLRGDVPVTGNWQYAEISVRNSSGVEVTSHDFGRATVNSSPRSVTLTISNSGNAALTMSNITAPVGYKISTPLNQLLPGQSTSITVSTKTNLVGVFNGNLSIQTNDGNENPKLIELRSTIYIPAPEIQITTGNQLLDSTQLGRPTVNFGNVPIFSTAPQKVFVIKNIGTATLTITSVSPPTGYVKISDPASSLEPGQSTSFVMRMTTNTLGRRTGDIVVNNNDSNEGVYKISAVGNVNRGPEINVTVFSSPVLDSGTINFGSTSRFQVRQVTLTIRNDGESALNISSWNIQGAFYRSGGTLNSAPRVLQPGTSVTLTVRMNTTTVGTKSGILSIYSDDLDEGSFDINLRGRVS